MQWNVNGRKDIKKKERESSTWCCSINLIMITYTVVSQEGMHKRFQYPFAVSFCVRTINVWWNINFRKFSTLSLRGKYIDKPGCTATFCCHCYTHKIVKNKYYGKAIDTYFLHCCSCFFTKWEQKTSNSRFVKMKLSRETHRLNKHCSVSFHEFCSVLFMLARVENFSNELWQK